MDSSPKRATRAKALRARIAPTASFMAGTRSTAAKRKTRTDDKDDEDLAKRDAAAKRPRAAAIPKKDTERDVAKPATGTAPAPPAAAATHATKKQPVAATTGAASKKPEPGNVAAPPKQTRGRPRKIVPAATAPEPAATARVSRSALSASLNRAKTTATTAATTTRPTTAKATTTATATTSAATARITATATARSTRTTTTTTMTRGATAATKTAEATGSSKPSVRKAVKFREPDKENLVRSKEPAATGLRGRPARRGGAAMARATTRATSKAAASTSSSSITTTTSTSSSSTTGPTEKKPLSTIKMAQNFAKWEESDDELAREKTPVKPLMKSPIKPPTAKKPVPAPEEEQQQQQQQQSELQPRDAADAADTPIFGQLDVNAFMSGSPVRPPHSPLGDGLRSPAKRIAALGSAIKPAPTEQISQSPLKTSLLQSAAKRPKSPIKGLGLQQPAQDQVVATSASKPSMFQSPAKRAIPGFRSVAETLAGSSSAFKDIPTLNPQAFTPAKASEKLLQEIKTSENADFVFKGPMESLRFRGRATKALSQDEVARILEMETVEEEGDDVDSPHDDAIGREQGMADIETVGHDEHDERDDNDDNDDNDENEDGDDPVNRGGEKDGDEAPERIEDADEEAMTAHDKAVDSLEDTVTVRQDLEDVEEPTECVAGEEAASPPDEQPNPLYELRERDQDPCHDMSIMTEDDHTIRMNEATSTPLTALHVSATSRGIASCVARSGRRTTLGFSSLADQLSAWSAASPIKAPPTARKLRFAEPLHEVAEADHIGDAPAEDVVDQVSHDGDGDSQMSDSFHENMPADVAPADFAPADVAFVDSSVRLLQDIGEKDGTIIFNDISFNAEDQALALEANEMSLSDTNTRRSFDDNLSDASQEYADENQVPPEHVEANVEPPAAVVVTPARPPMNSFHTTTKIPLKPSDDSTPSPIKKRSFSAPRAAPKRSGDLPRATPFNLGTPQERRRSPRKQAAISEETAPSTPSQTIESWSAAETPGRTPRKDVNPSLLRGAIVFVDVHTSEGADASGIFVELLTQMGARCVKTWNWSPSEGNASTKKVGITHVVFKDGSKRTLEKVREADGVVQCVGVGWVLNCEHANEWLDEAQYSIDASTVPRGGARRRKSMEPKSLNNMKGNLVSSPGRSGRESVGGAPSTPRRQSTMWMPSFATPDGEGAGGDDIEGSSTFLTPVPKTPAPEAIARFAAETPSDGYGDEEDDTVSPLKEELLMRTCPAKSRFREAGGEGGGGILNLHQSLTQDEDVRVRLMAARRKSLQFAPKVGSPLAKMWR